MHEEENIFCKKRRPIKEDTRSLIMHAAGEEIHEHGYQGASLNAIIKRAGVTKGALYHHFESKLELGYSLVDECLSKMFDDDMDILWALDKCPLESMLIVMRNPDRYFSNQDKDFGCPVFALAQEMSPLDDGFKLRFSNIFEKKFKRFAKEFKRGQEQGSVRKDLNCDEVAVFVVATFQGLTALAKNIDDKSFIQNGMKALVQYLESLRV